MFVFETSLTVLGAQITALSSAGEIGSKSDYNQKVKSTSLISLSEG